MGFAKLSVLVAMSLVTQVSCRKVFDGSKPLTVDDGLPAPGLFAKQMVIASKSTAAGLTITTKTERLQLVRLSQAQGRLELKTTTCNVRSVSSSGSELAFPGIFVKSIPETTYSYEVDASSAKPVLRSNKLIEILGARLNDVASEALPKSKSDARVIDQDNDGHPGMSVNLKVGFGPVKASGQVYIVQRATWRETSTSVTSDTISGTLDVSLDQETLGSDSPILGSVSAKVVAMPNSSTFTLKRLADGATCESLLKEAQNLFGVLKI